MSYNKESSYGRGIADGFLPISANGRQFIVGASTLTNVQFAEQIFKPDTNGSLRFLPTIAQAVAAATQVVQLSVTGNSTANTFTTVAPHGLSNGDKVNIGGGTVPSSLAVGVTYYVVGVTQAAPTVFQVSTIRGGTAASLGSTGTTVLAFPLKSTGDVIYVLPSHNENISSATALNINVSGLTIVGMGYGDTRPTLVLDTATTATITVSAPGVVLRNLIIDATGFDAIASVLTVTASDVQILGCKFILANATNQAGIAITTTAQANRLIIDSNVFTGTTDAGRTNDLQLIGGNDIQITNNTFYGAYTTSLGAVNNITTACLRIYIAKNTINNATASSTKAIVLLSTTTGEAVDNRLAILSGTAPITGAAISMIQNFYVAAVGAAATQGTA